MKKSVYMNQDEQRRRRGKSVGSPRRKGTWGIECTRCMGIGNGFQV